MFILLRPVGLGCQLSCAYCYYKAGHPQLRSSKTARMDLSIVDKVIDGLGRLPERFHVICLHGGEPTLVGKPWFRSFALKIKSFNQSQSEKKISIAIQTNGIDIDDEWIELFKDASVGVSVSLDGPEAIHDSARVDMRGNGTYQKVACSIQKMQEAKLDPSVIAVITKESTTVEPSVFYQFFVDLGITEIDIAPYVETGNSEKEKLARSRYECDLDSLIRFINQFFDVWFCDSNDTQYVNIRSFEQTIGALLGYTPTLCNRQGGYACGRTPCVMPDGTVFACDLETDQVDLQLGSLKTENFEEILQVERLKSLHDHIKDAFEALGCHSCGLLGLCAFACPRFAFSGKEVSSYCKFTRKFVSHVQTRLNAISEILCQQALEFDFA